MTVNRINQSQDRISGSDLLKSKDCLSSGNLAGGKKMGDDGGMCQKWKVFTEVETDQESGGSSEEFESPKSVTKVWRWRKSVHNQVLRIREEDSHLGEDIGEGLSAKDKLASASAHHVASQMDVVLFSRPILPSSPLGSKTAIKASH